jgi:uncharacterized Zn finger protein
MSRFGWYRSAPKKPPPARGIRIEKPGTTWWGQRWIEALEDVLGGDAGRLARGRTYARAGRTHDLVVKGGKVRAKVTGSRPTPYQITIELTELSATAWKQAIDGLATKAQFSADLLAGQMPQAIDEVFVAAGVSLFPKQRADLRTSCSCPDWGDPCKHVAATHYVLGDALDRDPFLLFELRGRTKDQVLDALRAARGGANAAAGKPAGKAKAKAAAKATAKTITRAKATAETTATAVDPTIDVPTVTLGKLTPGEYEQPRGPLPTLHFRFDEPVTHGAVLRQLGAPTAWQSEASPADVLAPLVRAAAEAARRIAMAEPSAPGEPPPSPPPPQSPPSPPSTRGRAARTGVARKAAPRRRGAE